MLRYLPLEFLVVFLLSNVFGHILPDPGCHREPTNFDSIKEEFQSSSLDERSLNDLPGLILGYPIGPDNINSSFVHIERVNFSGFEFCPTRPNGTVPQLNGRSTCPVRWVMNFDQNRIPRDLVEVECSCENCLEFAPDGRQTQNVCQPVYNLINALRRVGCDGEFYQYARVVEKVKVACTCAHPYIQDSRESNPSGPTISP